MSSGSFLHRVLVRNPKSPTPADRRLRVIPRLEELEARETPAAYLTGTFAVATESVGGPRVQVYQIGATGGFNLAADFFAYDAAYTGGVSVAVGDFDGDGINDVATCSKSVVAHVKVFKGISNGAGGIGSIDPTAPIASFLAPGFRGGNIALGNFDTTNDPAGLVRNEIAIGATVGGPRVAIFRNALTPAAAPGVSSDLNGGVPIVAASFFVGDSSTTGGVTVAAGNLDDSTATASIAADELVVGSGFGQQGVVRVYNFNVPGVAPANALNIVGTNANYEDRNVVTFLPYGATYTAGVNVAVGNVIFNTPNTDVASEIIVGTKAGPPVVEVFGMTTNASGLFTGVNTTAFQAFVAFDTPTGYTGGVNVGFNNIVPTNASVSIMVTPGRSTVPAGVSPTSAAGMLFANANVAAVFGAYSFNTTTGVFVTSSLGGIFDLSFRGGLSISE